MMSDSNDNLTRPSKLTPEQEKQLAREWRVRRCMRDARSFGLYALILVVIVYTLFGWIVGFAVVPNEDMFPRFSAGDLLLYYRLDKDVKSQDVIVFNKNDTRYVGRVVGIAGDEIEITDDERLSVNGSVMIERGISGTTPRLEGYTQYPLVLEPDTCFVLVDARQGGEDSRYFGPVHKEEISGKVISLLRRNNL